MTKANHSIRRGFQLSLGPITAPTQLLSVIPSQKDEVRTLCKEHKVPINQVYRCPKDGEIRPETVKGLSLGGDTYQVYEQEALPDYPADPGITFTAVPAEAFLDACLPAENNYYVAPEATAAMAWEVFYRLAQDRKLALIGVGALRENSRKLYRLSTFNGYLTLQSYAFPEHIREAPERPEVSVPRTMMTLARQFLASIEVEWAKFDSTDVGRKAFRDYVEAQGTPVNIPSPESLVPEKPIDLMEALKASVTQLKKKPTKRKAS